MTDGNVRAIAVSGNTLYIGGGFSYVGPTTGSFVSIDATSAALRPGLPRVDGDVYVAASDGAGGWYIGGRFQKVAGVPRSCLAHVRADGTLDGWNPGADNEVRALVVSGATVYAGGWFTSIGGQARNDVAALDAVTGLATAWNPSGNGEVMTLVVSGSTVYVGGGFTSIGGQARSFIAALDAVTGLATAWNPTAVSGGVLALAVNGSTVYAGGGFTGIGGQPRSRIAALDATTGLATPWDPGANSYVWALAVNGTTIYAGGNFASIGGQPRNYIAALDATTGLATAWNPSADSALSALIVNGSTVYAGGGFANIGGKARGRIAALDATTGLATSWNPRAGDGAVIALAVSDSTVCAGGSFTTIGGKARNGIAALDVTTGIPTAWNPLPSGPPTPPAVLSFAVDGSKVYAGGTFGRIGGQFRSNIAALDAETGLATDWNPGAVGSVLTLRVDGSTVYAGGNFTSIGGQARSRIAALDAETGLATAWNPSANNVVYALAPNGSEVYAGGFFTNIGGQARSNIAALDATTGLATAWNPSADVFVDALTVGGSTVYVGGGFGHIGGQLRHAIAALDATTGLATTWDPSAYGPGPTVYAVEVSGSTVYAGGGFTGIGGQPRSNIAALDAAAGLATPWDSSANDFVLALAMNGPEVYAGGTFTTIGGRPARGVAGLLPEPAAPPSSAVLSPNGGESVDIRTTYGLSWNASTAAPGVQSVDLYLSRAGAGGPWELLAAGAPNTGHYDWTVTGPVSGNCFLRVDARDYAGGIGSDISDAGFTVTDGSLAVGPPAQASFALSPVAPDPARGLSSFSYVVPRLSHVRLTLLDVQGRQLAALADGEREPGRYAVTLDAAALPPGLHFIRMRAPGVELVRRLVILR